jgi:hypothetical protein
MDAAAVLSFQEALGKSTRILALCGAGLSAASGLPTFRGNGGIWRNHQATALATPGAFAANPGLVWQFYAYRRHMALQASPNPAHVALAELAKKMKETDGFACLTQNVDGEFGCVFYFIFYIRDLTVGAMGESSYRTEQDLVFGGKEDLYLMANEFDFRLISTGWPSCFSAPSSPWLTSGYQMFE